MYGEEKWLKSNGCVEIDKDWEGANQGQKSRVVLPLSATLIYELLHNNINKWVFARYI